MTAAVLAGPVDAPSVAVIGSPRMRALAGELAESGQEQAARRTEAFWAEVAERGTPLVEAIDDDPEHLAVTFVWRGGPDDGRVLLVGNRLGDRTRRRDQLLEHIPDSDVWHLTLRLRRDHRVSYQLAADTGAIDGLTVEELEQELGRLAGQAVPDPWCSELIETRWSTSRAGVLSLPEAPVERWRGLDGRPVGTRDVLPWPGVPGVEGRDVHRYRSGGPDDDQVVVVLCDGEMWLDTLRLDRVIGPLVAAGHLPPLTVLAPDAQDVDRRWGDLGGNADFVDALADDLIGRGLEGHRPPPARTVLAGQSLGGLTALLGAVRRPEVFGAAVAGSPSLWWRPGHERGLPRAESTEELWLSTLAARADLSRARVRVGVGLHEGAMVTHARAFGGVLRDAGADVGLTEYNGGHDYACWRQHLIEGLVEVLGEADPADAR